MIETHNIFPPAPPFPLDSHQLLGVDVVPIVSGVSPRIAAAGGTGNYPRAILFKTTEKHSAAFVWVGLLSVIADSVVLSVGEFEHDNC